MNKKRKGKSREKLQPPKQKKFFSFDKKALLGVMGGSGFLLIIKGFGGLVESIFKRPSAQWRTDITFGNLFLYLIIVLITLIAVNYLTFKKNKKKRIYQIVGVTIAIVSFAFILTLTIPIFQTTILGIHPVILILAGAVMLPASGNLTLK